MHQQVEVVGLGDFAEFVACVRANQLIEPRPALPLVISPGDTLGQCLVGLLTALVFALPGAQFGTLLFAGGQLRVQFNQGPVE